MVQVNAIRRKDESACHGKGVEGYGEDIGTEKEGQRKTQNLSLGRKGKNEVSTV